jgi:hypothetical protein
MSARLAAFYRAGHMNGTTVEQQLLGHGCFTGVRMRNNGKSSAPGYFAA